MKKILWLVVFTLTAVIASPVFAVSENASENAQNRHASPSPSVSTSISVSPSASPSISSSPASNYGQSKKNNEGLLNPRSETAREHMSAVAKMVEQLHALANQTGEKIQGFGQQVSAIAQNQVQAANQAAEAIDINQERSKFVKFLIGPHYEALNQLNQARSQYEALISQLNQLMTQLQNEADKQALQNIINEMQQEMNQLSSTYDEQAKGFSLFGWLVKLF